MYNIKRPTDYRNKKCPNRNTENLKRQIEVKILFQILYKRLYIRKSITKSSITNSNINLSVSILNLCVHKGTHEFDIV